MEVSLAESGMLVAGRWVEMVAAGAEVVATAGTLPRDLSRRRILLIRTRWLLQVLLR